ncbi:hypothetical protein HPB48_015897 [Haemaphysalis longicornis]|uniref:FERM domain-containing protein 8 n=1 Tax=Haemaphysalis longicornis TaxID=44386 RepID=A0A9J6GKF9_HAELO|nr:hypothetical protein HPB48_015897 [Haemaphysalis longicornis]
MRDLVPEEDSVVGSSSSGSEDEEESERASMMKHQHPAAPHEGSDNYMTHNCVTIIPVEYPRSDNSSPLSACTLRGGPAAGGGDKRNYATLDHRHHHHNHHHHQSAPYAVSVPALTAPTTVRRQLPTPTHHHHPHNNQYHHHPPGTGGGHHMPSQQQQHGGGHRQCYQLPTPLVTRGDDGPGWRILPPSTGSGFDSGFLGSSGPDSGGSSAAPAATDADPGAGTAAKAFECVYKYSVSSSFFIAGYKEQELCVYLLNKVCLCVEVGNVQLATAQEIIEVIAEDESEINLPAQVKDVFALWMTSPLLELQLKPDHRPYLIRERWSEYLKKYTFATRQQLESGECLETQLPSLVSDLKLLRMLYSEAKGNVLDGRYPCETEDCMVLGAIQARLELGPYDAAKHTPEARIRDFLPEHACRSHWFLLGLGGAKHGPERRLSEHYQAIASNVKDGRLMRKYLEFCWAFPYYGSAFFSGQVERPVRGLAALMDHYDLPVLVAINRLGIHLMDQAQPAVLLSLPYKQLSWDYACPTQADNPDCLPCLFLQFQLPGQSDTSVVQIFSRQAVLMDALISTIVDELKKRASWSEPDIDPGAVNSRADDDIQVPLTVKKLRQEQGLSGRFRKLSIAKFNSSGEWGRCSRDALKSIASRVLSCFQESDYLNSKGSLEFRRDDRPR